MTSCLVLKVEEEKTKTKHCDFGYSVIFISIVISVDKLPKPDLSFF